MKAQIKGDDIFVVLPLLQGEWRLYSWCCHCCREIGGCIRGAASVVGRLIGGYSHGATTVVGDWRLANIGKK